MKKICAFIFVSFLFVTSQAQSGIESYLSAPFPSDLTSSKDGRMLAWVFNDKGSRNIYIASNNGSTVKQITDYSGDDGIEIHNLAFTPDNKQVVFVRGNTANGRGEIANPAFLQIPTERVLYIINTDGANLRKIANGSSPEISPAGNIAVYISSGQIWSASLTDTTDKPVKLFQSRGGQSDLTWSPDSRSLAFTSNRGDHSFVGIYHFDTKKVNFVETSVDQDGSPVWSVDGKWLAYIRVPNIHNLLPFSPVRESNPWSIRILNIQTGEIKEVWKAPAGKGSAFTTDIPVSDKFLWWSNHSQLIFPYEKDGWVHLYMLNPANRTIHLLTPGNGEVENVTLSNDGQTVFYTTNIGDINRRHIWKLEISSGKTEQLTKGNEIEWSPVIMDNDIALFHSSATKPAWPAIYINNEVKDIAADLFPKQFPLTLVQPQAVTITAADGLKSTADLFLPNDYKANEKHPAVIFLHGGSRRQMLLGFHYSQYYSNAYALNQYFASKGYIVLSLNYRSGIGYGLDFREALNYGATGASEVKDLLGAGLFLQKRSDVDPKKIALWGGSYGGYLTAHGLSQAPNLFAVGVDIHGVHNWNDEIPTFAPWYDYAKFPEIAKKALQSSPVYHIKNWRAPVLLIHGDDDRNVPFSESVNVAETLRKQGVHVEQLIFPDEVHSFLLHQNWIKAYEATFEFINREFAPLKK
jgi:dipeptidyl aminopeptidase/acylaminoacyl peptidase